MQDFGKITSGMSRISQAVRSDFGQLTGAFAAAQGGAALVMAAFEGVARQLQAMNEEVIDAERVASKLIAVFDGAEGAAARLTAQAEALAGSTVFFDDDAIKSAAAALRGFELTEQEISKLLPVAVNLATVFDSDLTSAATKLALGLNGSTKGLREFEIITKEGADRAEIFAQILERGEKAAKGAADAQGGLRGATEGLKKAQGEFNQALGTLLAGPNASFLQFLTDATNKAANLANKMSGAAEAVIKARKVIDPTTGKIVEATGVGGKDLFGPGSLTAQFIKGQEPAKAAETKAAGAKPAAAGARPAGRAATLPTAQGFGPGMELGAGVNVFKAIGAAQLAAEVEIINRRDKAAQEAADAELAAVIEADKKALETANELRKIRLEAADQEAQVLEDAAKTFASAMLSSADKAAGILGKALSGQSLQAQDFIGLGTMVATAIFPAFGPLIAILGSFVGALAGGAGGTAKVTTLSEDKARLEQLRQEQAQARNVYETELSFAVAQNARKEQIARIEEQILAKERETAEINAETARRNRSAAQEQARGGLEGMLDQFRPLGDRVAKQFKNLAEPFTVFGQEVDALFKAFGELKYNMSQEQIQALGGRAREALKTGDTSALRNQFSYLNEDQFNALLAVLANVPGGAGEPPPELGDTPRNPVYVFDVTPSKDEFTRAPRGMFFRPVGSGRGVDAGQSVSGVSANTSNRASRGRTDPSRRMA
jgi:hypothetical protein